MEKKKLGIYIHIPFCVKKCLYCDFLSAKATGEERAEYVDSLVKEIEYYALDDADFGSQYAVSTIFFGGGTPSILEPEKIGMILEAVHSRFEMNTDVEITIECNPGTATKEKLIAWKQMGINRLSIGLQSANDDELKALGRIHDYDTFIETYRDARKAGFTNVNIDLMSAIPGQTIESYQETLEKVIALKPEHISAYSLIVEEETPFFDIYGEEKTAMAGVSLKGEIVPEGIDGAKLWPDLPDEDTEREMYYLTEKLLGKNGYHRYEISNYSLEDYECRHNKSYWDGTDYIGFGLGASSYVKDIRYSNTEDWYKYLNACRTKGVAQNQPYFAGAGDYDEEDDYIEELQEAHHLSRDEFGALLLAEKYHEAIQLIDQNEQMEEFMYLGLRMMKGVSRDEFARRFHTDIDNIYSVQLKKLAEEGMLNLAGDTIALTSKGIDVSNRVLANFLL